MGAAQGVGGDVNYFQTKIRSRMTAQETTSTEDATAVDTGVGWGRQVFEKTSKWSANYRKGQHNVGYVRYASGRKLNARAKR